MKRRTFTFGLGALAAAPTMPFAATAVTGQTAAQHFHVARILARAHNHCTAAMLERHLKVTPDMARQVRTLLLDRGVITAPVNGVSMAVNPTNTNCVPAQALKPSNLVQKAKEMRHLLERFQGDSDEISSDENPDSQA